MHPLRERLSVSAERLTGWSLAAFALLAVASIAMQNWIFVALAAWAAGMALKRRWALRPTPMNVPLLLLALILVLASLADGHVNSSFFGLRKIGLMAIFFLTAAWVDQPLKAERYVDLFLAGAAVCALASIFKHFMKWDGGRATSFSGDYMAAGGMYMLALVPATARVLYGRPETRRYALAVAALLAAALLFTYTRSSWIGALVGLAILTSVKDWRLPVVSLILITLFLVLFPSNPVSRRAFSLASKYQTSNSERRLMWKSGLKLLRDRPLQGYGVDNLSEYYGRYADPRAIEQRPPHVHNTLLQLALNGGLLAPLAYLAWAAAFLGFAFRAWQRQRAWAPESAGMILGLAAAFSGFLVNGLFEFNFGTAQVISLVFFLTGLLPAYASAQPGRPGWPLPTAPRLLFLRPRFRGDVLLASAIPRLVKRDFPGARVDLLTEPGGEAIAAGEPAWDAIISLPRRGLKAWWRAVKQIRANDYDVVADLFGNPRTAQLTWFSGARCKIGPRVRAWGVVYQVRTHPDRPGRRLAWEAYFDILRILNINDLGLKPRWVVSAEDQAWAESFLAGRGLKAGAILGFFPGASHPSKRWPLENFMELARRAQAELGMKSLFVFGPQEAALSKDYARNRGDQPAGVEHLTPGQLAALWAACAVVVSNDAFPMHLGPAVGTPTLGLFGPGEPGIWFPYEAAAGHHALHVILDCWPCHRDFCEAAHCWRELTPERVFAELKTAVRIKG